MRTALLAVVALAAAVTAAPAAADPDHYYRGGCRLVAVPDPTAWQPGPTPRHWQAVVHAYASATDGDGAPSTDPLWMTCDLYVDGSLVAPGVVSSNGEPAVGRTRYPAEVDDVVTICERVTVGSHQPTYHCTETPPVVPGPVWTAPDVLVAEMRRVAEGAESTFCSVAATLAGQYGPVLIDTDGGVYTVQDDEPHNWYDCPPHDGEPPGPGAQPPTASG